MYSSPLKVSILDLLDSLEVIVSTSPRPRFQVTTYKRLVSHFAYPPGSRLQADLDRNVISYFWNLKLIPSNGVFMNNAAYAEESETGSPPGLYYLVHWKGYPVSDNTWEPSSGVKHLRRLLVTYHKRNPKEPTASSVPIAPRPPSAKKSYGPNKGIGRFDFYRFEI